MFVITGGGSGIGQALAEALVQKKQRVCIIGRRLACLKAVAQLSPDIQYICADVSTSTGRAEIVKALKKYPKLDGLIHNAGIIEPIAPMTSLTESEWHSVMHTNVDAPLFLTQALSHLLIGGRVLNIGSGAAYIPIQGWAAYCVSKAALAMLTRCWQLEYPEIAFASIMPGIIDTPMQAKIRASHGMSDEKYDFFVRLKNENKLLTASQVASYMVHLLLEVSADVFSSKEWDIYESYAEYPDES